MKKEDLRIVFFGTPDFAVESLSAIVDNGYNVVGVVTMPDKPAGRGHKMLHSPVQQYAEAHGLNLLQPVKLKDPEFLEELRSLNADLFIVIAFRMLPEAVWQMPPLGTFNLHASLLPRYRGAAPINRAVMNGDTETGVTTFMLKHEIDTGDILAQERVEIRPEENVGDVHDKLMAIGARVTLKTIDDIVNDRLQPVPQDELIKDIEPCPAPKIFTDDCIIDWTKPAHEIHNLVRGLSPYPAARSELINGGKPEMMKILQTKPVENYNGDEVGKVEITADGRMIVATGQGGGLELLEVHPAGKKRMAASAWLRGAHLFEPHFKAK